MTGQMANLIAHKGRRSSIYFQGFKNFFQLWGYTAEIMLGLLLVYVPAINGGIGTRGLQFLHFGVPAVPFALWMMFYDEMRKLLVNRSADVKTGEKPGWWYRNYSY